MYRQLLTLLFSFSAGCSADSDATMDHDAACHEQADAWCTASGFATSLGCRAFYTRECEPSGPDGAPISMGTQNACLQAIADTVDTIHTGEPAACQETWK